MEPAKHNPTRPRSPTVRSSAWAAMSGIRTWFLLFEW